MAIKSCRVTCTDASGVDHSVEVTAEILYEAVAQALRLFRDNDWTSDTQRIPSVVGVRVKQPVMEHCVCALGTLKPGSMQRPRVLPEMVLKNRLRELLDR